MMIKMTSGVLYTEEYGEQLNDLILEAFHFSFDKWHEKKVWDDDFERYSIIENGVMLAQISVFKMKMLINGKKKEVLQLGGVATREEYRGKGLSREIMEHILAKYPDTPAFLHGGNSVVDFYPKFGFKPFQYKQPYIECKLHNQGEMIKLDIKDPKVDMYLKERNQYSKILDCLNQYSIDWFHLLYSFENNIYEIPQLDLMFVAKQKDNRLMIYDIVAKRNVTFEEIAPHLCFEGVHIIEFDFNPDWLGFNYKMREYKIDDCNPFVRGDLGVKGEYMIPGMMTT